MIRFSDWALEHPIENIDPRVSDKVNEIAREIICDRSYFTDEDDDSILKLIDAKEDIMGNEERKSTEDIKKEILAAIEAYNKSVKKKKKPNNDSSGGLAHFMGRYGPVDNDEEDTEDDS